MELNEETERGFEDGVKNIVWALRRIVSLIYQDSRKMVKRFGITGPQGLVIKILYTSSESLSSAALSRQLNVTPPNITGIIDRLEEKELIRRVRKLGDRRTTLIELTDKGMEFGESLPDPIEEKLMSGLGDLQPTEIFGIYSALNTIVNIIGVEQIATTPLDQEMGNGTEHE